MKTLISEIGVSDKIFNTAIRNLKSFCRKPKNKNNYFQG